MFFDGVCSEGDAGTGEVLVFPTQECIDSSFILTFQVTNDTSKCEADLILQQVYKTSQSKHLRLKAYAEEVKYRPSLPDNIKCSKLFEVEDQINRLLQVFDELADIHIDQGKETFHGNIKRVNFQFGDCFLKRDASKEGYVFDGPFNGLFFELYFS